MAHRRRRTDQLASAERLPLDPLARARAACSILEASGIEASLALQLPADGGQGIICAAAGRTEHAVDVARGLARHAVSTARPLALLDSTERIGLRRWRHAAMPIGAVRDGAIVLVVSDPRLTRREAQAITAWVAAPETGSLTVDGGPIASLAHGIAHEFGADTVVLALFAEAGMLVQLYLRSGALLHTWRIPSDTVWGEVARHGASFTLGDLELHPGVELLASVGMRNAALVGLENGHGIAIGALGVASSDELDIDVAHHLLARAPLLGPEVMNRLSSTQVPVAEEDGSVDVGLLAARVGCRRFAMYRVDQGALQLVSAHAPDGTIDTTSPQELETRLAGWALEQGTGVVAEHAAAVLIGTHTVLFASDPERRPLECLRRALQDVRRNPFSAQEEPGASFDEDGGSVPDYAGGRLIEDELPFDEPLGYDADEWRDDDGEAAA
ncbi:MAG: hypothetical protein H7287_04155 [Thermoleophilia bacterium]|nr:hypothetical protein [Thermoleophilia bacterium]